MCIFCIGKTLKRRQISGISRHHIRLAAGVTAGVTTVQVRVLKYECNSLELRADAERGALREQRLHA